MSVIVLPEGRVDEFVELVYNEDESIALRLRGEYAEWAAANLKSDYTCKIRTFTNREGTMFGASHILIFNEPRDAVLFKLWWF